MKVKKGDTVKILAGKDKDKSGKIIKAYPDREKVVVEGLNLVKRHIKPRKQGEKGQIIEKPRAVSVSNVMLVCGNCKKATRVGYRFENNKKVRVCKKCNKNI